MKDVVLYIRGSVPHLDFIDIASELTRFVLKKPLDLVVHAISDKLSSPLQTLKRRGIPVDRLLKNKQQQQQQGRRTKMLFSLSWKRDVVVVV